MDNVNTQKICRNCESTMSDPSLFCSACGQKYTTGKVTLTSFLKSFFSDVFDLNSKLYRSLWALFIPGKLTNEFFSGRHVRYAPPFRIFIVASLVYVLGFSSFLKSTKEFQVDYKRSNLYERQRIVNNIDSLHAQGLIPTKCDQIDTTIHFLKNEISEGTFMGMSFVNLPIYNPPFQIESGPRVNQIEIYSEDVDTIIKKYKVEGFINIVLSKQIIRANKNPSQLVTFIISRMSIILLLMMPFTALILKLLYIRQKRYFVEHLVFSIHTHSFVFILMGISILIFSMNYQKTSNGVSMNHNAAQGVAFIMGLIYFFMAMKRVYGQKKRWTIIKFLLANMMYVFLFTFFVVIAFLVSLLLF